jgi:FkbM family methyltransferase
MLSKKHLDSKKPQLAVYSFDYIGTTIGIDGYYEIRELELIDKWLKSKHSDVLCGTFLDIGANIGNHSVYFSSSFNKIKSFEPNPYSFSLLEVNTRYLNNVEVFDFGLSDKSGVSSFFASKYNIGGSSLYRENSKEPERIKVKLKSLDEIDFQDEKITFIKIDVEGHEMLVLEGGKETFEKYRPIVAFEQHEHEFINGESAVINKLKEYGYNDFYCIKSSPVYIRPWMPFKNIIRLVHQILFGSSKMLVKQDFFNADFYPLILGVNKKRLIKFIK